MSENLSQAIQNNDLIKIKQLIEQQDVNELKKEFGQVWYFFVVKIWLFCFGSTERSIHAGIW